MVGGVFIALTVAFVTGLSGLPAILIGSLATLVVAVGFLRHQWTAWMRVAKALPIKA